VLFEWLPVPSHPVQHPSSEEDPDNELLPEPGFPTRPWGYDRAAVDAYVQHTEAVFAEALAERTPEGAVKAALDRLGDETSAVLQNAHQIADEITARSREQADVRLEQAEEEAAEIKRAAEQRVAALDVELDKLWQERQRLLADMERISVDLHSLVTGADERFPIEEEASDDVAEGDQVTDEPLEAETQVFEAQTEAGAMEAEAGPERSPNAG